MPPPVAPTASGLPIPVPTAPAKVTLLPPAPAMNDVAFPDARHGWLGGDGEILGTTDGGRTWRVEWREPGMLVAEVDALDATHAWAFAQHVAADGELSRQTILRTVDGRRWAASPVPHTMAGLRFTSASSGWAIDQGVVPQGLWTTTGVGQSAGRLAYTGDGGRTWVPTGVPSVDAVCFDGSRLGWAVGPSGVWSSSDAGRRWGRVGPEPRAAFSFGMSLACRGGRLWLLQNLMGGAGGHQDYAGWASTDGGRRWRQVLWNGFFPGGAPTAFSADAYPGPLVAPSASTAIEAGWSPSGIEDSITVTRDGGRTWRTTRVPGIQNAPRIAAPDALHWFLLAQSMTGSPVLVATADGGRTWREAWPTGSPAPEGSVAFVSTSLGYGTWLPGDDRAVVRSIDGGQTWSRLAELPEPAAAANPGNPELSFPDADHGWAVTASGRVLATSDGGLTWRRVALPPGSTGVKAVAFADSERGCVQAASPDGSALVELRTADGGRSWSPVQPVGPPVLACAWGDAVAPLVAAASRLTTEAVAPALDLLDARTAWLPTDAGVWWTADGGATWDGVAWPRIPDDRPQVFAGVPQAEFVSPTRGWLVAGGAILRTDDGGRTWTQLS